VAKIELRSTLANAEADALAVPEFAPLIINLRRNVVACLSREVWRTFDSIPSQGMEIGGLLLGTVARETRVIEIEDFEPLAWNGRPERFVLSESECRALKTTLATCAWLQDRKLNVVGCYRSHLGEGFSLSADDLQFAQNCFQGPSGVFLLIKPSSGGTLTAAFFSWGNGQNDFEYIFQEFPFDVRQLADEPAETCEPRVSDDAKTAPPIADGPPVERSFPVAFSETRPKPRVKVAVRVRARRHRRRVWRAAALLARTRALWSVQTFLRRTRAFPWRARTLQVLGYPFALARAASQRVRSRVGQAGALVHRAFLAPMQTFLLRARAFPWRARTLQVLGYPFALARAASQRVRSRVGQAGALVHRALLAPMQTFLLRTRAFPWRARTLQVLGYPFALARAASQRVRSRVGQAGALVHRAFLAPVQAFLLRARAFPWRARALQMFGYPFAVGRAASQRVLTRVGRAGALVHRAFLAPVQTFLLRARAFPWRARTLQVLGYSFAVGGAASRRVRTRVGQAGALVHRALLAPMQIFLLRARAFAWRARTLQMVGYPFAVARAASPRVQTRVEQAGALVHRAFLALVQVFLLRARTFPWRADVLGQLRYLIVGSRAISRGVLRRGGAFINQSTLASARTSLLRTRTFPWWVRALRVPRYSYALLIIVMGVLGYRVYLSQVGSRASAKGQMISGRPSNLSRSQQEVLAMPVVRSAQTSAAPSRVTSGQIAGPLKRVAATGHRARRKPRVSSGKQPPFTCSPRDVFHKTDAAPGWNTFTCRGKNVWSITKNMDRL
jgi:hypothetical protein